MSRWNWARNYRYRASALHRPSTLEQVQSTVARAPRIKVLGSRHSFTGIADSTELLSLAGLPPDLVVDRDAGTVSFSGALRYGELAERLKEEGLALANLASLPHISVAGAVATASHGSGNRNGNLATAVASVELVTSEGDVLTVARGDADFDGLVVGLGALGVATRLTLEVQPDYVMWQRVFEGLDWDALSENFDAITGAGYSVSLFTRWRGDIDQVWVKSRGGDDAPRADFFGATAATAARHPIRGLDPVNCSDQLGEPGPWSDRLPHFRMGFTPSSGEELQSEYIVPRRHALEAIAALRAIGAVVAPLLQVSEIRTVAADGLWMSPQYGRDTVALHFTWKPEPDEVAHALVRIEDALGGFEARPHWGKLFAAGAGTIAPLYERWAEFVALVERLDARGAFRNEWLAERVLGDA
jgi:alditol oxidase